MVVLMLKPKWRAVFVALGAAFFFCSASYGQSSQRDQPIIWGVCGHPTWTDYGDWIPANTDRQIDLIQQLGCTYYRCSFEGSHDPEAMDKLVPKAQAAGITVLPDLPISIVPKNDAKTNYDTNYALAKRWAGYAIAKHYHLPYWELGNELENWNLVKVEYDGAAPGEYPDKTPGGFVAMAAALKGAYQGLHDTYREAAAKGEIDVVPQVLFGATFRHWGLLTKIGKYDEGLPFDIISWHWYEPNHGLFSVPIHDDKSFSRNRSPAQCLADFKSHTHPDQPMDVWITEMNRSIHGSGGWQNGSFAETLSGQDWAGEAQQITSIIADLKAAPNVKAIFVYELIDDHNADKNNAERLRSEGNYGLITGLNGTYKDAFYAYQKEIKQSH